MYKKRTHTLRKPRLDSEETRNIAFNYSLKYLSYRARSIKEVYDFLVSKNFVEQTINAVIEKLNNLKFLNDEEFGRLWIESRQKHKGKSKFILRAELKLKGLSNDLIEPLLKGAQDDLDTARTLFVKKKRILGKLITEDFKKKMGSFLQRKGFSFEIINKLIRGD